jgi:putative transposase
LGTSRVVWSNIDLNMVRAGAIHHPREWAECGYREIQQPPERYRIIDRAALCELLGVEEQRLAAVQNEWIDSKLARRNLEREAYWSEALAVGRRVFVERVRQELQARARYRRGEEVDGASVLREAEEAYGRHFEIKNAPPTPSAIGELDSCQS